MSKKIKKVILISTLVIALLIGITGIIIVSIKPEIYLEPVLPQPLTEATTTDFYIDVKLSAMGEATYPAASVEINFDNTKLEFIECTPGTAQIYDSDNDSYYVPQWQADAFSANSSGKIQAIYLDMTAGKESYTSAGFFRSEKDTLVRLHFQTKNTVRQGNTLKFTIHDAVLATVNGSKNGTSLSSEHKSLRTKNCTLTV